MESQASPQEEKKLDHKEPLDFCPMCFASSEGGSWGVGVVGDHCMNCGAGGTVRIPRWAVDSIRTQASWVGRRYYPGPEDRERADELKALRALPTSFPGRRAEKDQKEQYRWWVTQDLPGNKNVSSWFKATSVEDALEASRYSLPYVPAEDLKNGQ